MTGKETKLKGQKKWSVWNATYGDPIGMTEPYLQKVFTNKKGALAIDSWITIYTKLQPLFCSWLGLEQGERKKEKKKDDMHEKWDTSFFACALPKSIECWCRQMDRTQHRMRIF